MPKPIEDLYRINHITGCWEWLLRTQKDGYGQYKVRRKSYLAHRFMYELHKGKIPIEQQIDHLCRNRSCVNPKHLEAVIRDINVRRGLRCKLTQEQVNEIREKYKTYEYTQEQLATEYKVVQSLISAIVNKTSWKSDGS